MIPEWAIRLVTVVVSSRVSRRVTGIADAASSRASLSRLPRFLTPFAPMLLERQREPFHRDGWIFEEKYDGYRCLAFKQGDKVRLWSRNVRDLTASFPAIAAAVAELAATTLVLDGEIAVFDERLVSHLGYLGRHAKKFARGRPLTPPVLVAFDCLYSRGRNLRMQPLHARREALEREIDGAPGPVVVARR